MIAIRRREWGRSMEPVIALAVLALVMGALIVNRGAIVPAAKSVGAAIGIYVGAILVFALVGAGLFAVGKRRSGYEIVFLLDAHERGIANERTLAIRDKWRGRWPVAKATEPFIAKILLALSRPGPHTAPLFDIAVKCEDEATPRDARLHAALASILPQLEPDSLLVALRPAARDEDPVRRDANLRAIFGRLSAKDRAWAFADLLAWCPVTLLGKPDDDDRWLARYANAFAPWKAELASETFRVEERAKGRLAKLLAVSS